MRAQKCSLLSPYRFQCVISDNKSSYRASSYQNACRTTGGTRSNDKPHPHLAREDLSLLHGAGPDPKLSDVTGDRTELEVRAYLCNYPVSVVLSKTTRPR